MDTIVDKINYDLIEILSFLKDNEKISLLNNADMFLKKVMLLSAASYFESEIIDILLNFTSIKSNNDQQLISFVENKAILRQYHTYFDWEKSNANKFFSLFGEDFKNEMSNLVKNDIELNESIKAFLELGNLRNLLAHKNFGAYNLDQNFNDIYELYKKAKYFTEYLNNKFLNNN